MMDGIKQNFILECGALFLLRWGVLMAAPKVQRTTNRTAVLNQAFGHRSKRSLATAGSPFWMAVALGAGLRQLRFLQGIEVAILGGLFLWLVTFRHRQHKGLIGQLARWIMHVDDVSQSAYSPTHNQPCDEVYP